MSTHYSRVLTSIHTIYHPIPYDTASHIIYHPIPSWNAVRNGTDGSERPFSVPVPGIPVSERTGRPWSPNRWNSCLFRQFWASRFVRNGVRNGTGRSRSKNGERNASVPFTVPKIPA